ncbi:MAG: cysteine desulfurase [Armatimonadota bacterium]|nr:cysteine desulfurase [Armatimonadota bacterium]
MEGLDVDRVRRDFPILRREVRGRPLVYLDNAATTQKPRTVLEAMERFYLEECANIHRGVHLLSEIATQDYEDSRRKIQRFLNAADEREIIFVRGATEAINLVAESYGRKNVQAGDEVIITAMEHHSNIVPWQMLCEEKGATLRVAPINDAGEIEVDEFRKLLNERTRFVSLVHISNSLGTINPVCLLTEMAHRWNVPVLLDGAQAVAHGKVDVQELDCDFYVFSGHKLFGPTGIGVLYGKRALLEGMPPYQGGGDMIRSVSFEKTTFNDLPYKFEAGTPHIAGAIGLGAAVDYLEGHNWDHIGAHENDLLTHATAEVRQIPGLRIIGTAREKASVLSFVMEGNGSVLPTHPHDIGTILDGEGVAIRTGHHCTQPLMKRFGIPATARASFSFYNTHEEVDALIRGLHRVQEVLG